MSKPPDDAPIEQPSSPEPREKLENRENPEEIAALRLLPPGTVVTLFCADVTTVTGMLVSVDGEAVTLSQDGVTTRVPRASVLRFDATDSEVAPKQGKGGGALGCFSFFVMTIVLGSTMGRDGPTLPLIFGACTIIVAIAAAVGKEHTPGVRRFARGYLIGAAILAALAGGCLLLLSQMKF